MSKSLFACVIWLKNLHYCQKRPLKMLLGSKGGLACMRRILEHVQDTDFGLGGSSFLLSVMLIYSGKLSKLARYPLVCLPAFYAKMQVDMAEIFPFLSSSILCLGTRSYHRSKMSSFFFMFCLFLPGRHCKKSIRSHHWEVF